MPENLQFETPKLLLVEGQDEVGFFAGFLNHLGLGDIQIVDYGGKNAFRPRMEAYFREPSFSAVSAMAVIGDADLAANSTFQSIRDALAYIGLPAPQSFMSPAGDSPRVSIFVMPDNSSPGALEDLCLAALSNSNAKECVGSFLECVEASGYQPPQSQSKAQLRALLASLEDSETRLGLRSQRSTGPPWAWNHPAFSDLARFLRNL